MYSYLHNTNPPITHSNLSGDTIFIQHNGLIKIGSIAPDIVNTHVKTCIDSSWLSKNRHFLAPELSDLRTTPSSHLEPANSSTHLQINSPVNATAVDIYAFGMVALEVGFFI